MNNSTNREVALALAGRGIHVFPCNADKAPKIKDWEQNAASSALKIETWWQMWPDALPAIPAGAHGLVVIDCDRRQDKDGVTAFRSICADNRIHESKLFIVETPSGGIHAYFRSEVAYGNAHSFSKGIDIRSKGGYVIAPGAPGYKIVQGNWDAIPALPEALGAFLKPKTAHDALQVLPVRQKATERERAYADSALADEVAKFEAMGEGSGRNAALNQAAHSLGTCVGAGWIERGAVEEALWEAAECNGYRAKDGGNAAWATLQSGLESGIAKPRSPLPVDEIPQYIRDSVATWIEAFKSKQAVSSSFIDSIKSPFDYESKEIEFAVQNFIPMSAITMFSGDAGCGKSTLVTWLAHAITEGEPFLGFAVSSPRNVLYLDRENTLPIVRERLTRLGIRPNSRFKYWGAHVCGDVPVPGSEGIAEWVKKTEPKPLIIVDGQTAFLDGKENDSQDIRAFYNPLRTIANMGAAVIVLHHTGKGESTKEFRGSADIKAAIDVGYVMWNDGGTRLTTATIKPFKARFSVIDEFAMSYQDGEFVQKDAEQASGMILIHLLQNNPGIIMKEFEELLRIKRFGRNQARKLIDEAIAAGTILTRKGERNATRLYLPQSISQS